MKASDFTEFLIRATPAYHAAILKDITPRDGWLMGCGRNLDQIASDVRWLPPKLRPLWAFRRKHPKMLLWQIGKRFRIKAKTVDNRLDDAWNIINERVDVWLKSLPKNQRRRERYARQKSWRLDPWKKGPLFTGTFPDLRSDWPPAKCDLKTPCDPEDPWAPMRHWDD